MITNVYYGSRVFHIERHGAYVIVDTLQGTAGDIPGFRTDTYPHSNR
jgi:hypothetical protein